MAKRENKMNRLRIPDTIESILEWTCISQDQRNIPEVERKPKTKYLLIPQNERNEGDIWPKNMELYFRTTRTALEWGDYTDVIYSFKSVYALGLWSYNSKDLFELRKFYKDHRIESIVLYYIPKNSSVRTSDFLCSIQSSMDLVEKLNSNMRLKEFAKMYFSIGNMMPI
ncbi:MAG: hypothetical protein K6E85_14405 [Lachnospiraceae bacterium]|nr:hypothetical protein [Lachnospiraceae bacterium]